MLPASYHDAISASRRREAEEHAAELRSDDARRREQRSRRGPALRDEDELEESGQLTIGVDGEQRSLEGLAAPGKPAPVSFEQREPDEPVTKPASAPFECDRCGETFDDGIDAGHHEIDCLPKPKSSKPTTPWGSGESTLDENGHFVAKVQKRPKPTTPRKHACSICGRLATAEDLHYSTHTGQRYCPLTDADACTRRRKKNEKES